MELGSVGVWSPELRAGGSGAAEAAAELEELGYGAIWFPGRDATDLVDVVTATLGATRHIAVATGVVSTWTCPPDQLAAMHAQITGSYPDRFLLGIGISHGPAVER